MRTIVSRIILAAATAGLVFAAGCDKSPVDRLINPVSTTGDWQGDSWLVYGDELRVDGALMPYTHLEGQTLDLSWAENPYGGSACIKFSWTGEEVTAYPDQYHATEYREHGFAGFSIIVAPTVQDYDAYSKDLTPAGYDRVEFYARGSLNANMALKVGSGTGEAVDVASISGNPPLTGSWQKFSVPIGSLTDFRDYIKVALVYSGGAIPGNGGTVYLDEIRLVDTDAQ